MNEILHANIFFLIASIATTIFCILVAMALYQVIKILKLIRTIVERIEAGSEQIAEDVAAFRTYMHGGTAFTKILGFIMRGRARNRKEE